MTGSRPGMAAAQLESGTRKVALARAAAGQGLSGVEVRQADASLASGCGGVKHPARGRSAGCGPRDQSTPA